MINGISYNPYSNDYYIVNWKGSKTRYTAEYVKALREDEKKRVPKMLDITKTTAKYNTNDSLFDEIQFEMDHEYSSVSAMNDRIKATYDNLIDNNLIDNLITKALSNNVYVQKPNPLYPTTGTATVPFVNNGINTAAGQATGGWVNPEPPSMPATTADLQAMKEEIIQEVCVFLENWLNEQNRDR